LMTLELDEDSPIRALPWIITFGPLSDDEDWEPVVCGPYERPHALALAEEIVADQELMAVVEPMMGFASVDEIRAEIADAQASAAESPLGDIDDDALFSGVNGGPPLISIDDDIDFEGDLSDDDDDDDDHELAPPLPTPAEIRAGMARIARKLAEST
jgi:hypothetical protein